MPVEKDRAKPRTKQRYTLEELVAGMTPDNQHEEQFSGPPVGAERLKSQETVLGMRMRIGICHQRLKRMTDGQGFPLFDHQGTAFSQAPFRLRIMGWSPCR